MNSNSDIKKNIRGGFSDTYSLKPEWDKSIVQEVESGLYSVSTIKASNFNISGVNNLAVTNEYVITSPMKPIRIQNNIIYFNDAYLANASQKYLVAAYLHEILHAYIGGADENLDHDDMSYNYINPMKEILVNIFPYLGNTSDPNNAYKLNALAWNGLNNTRAWQDQGEAWGAAQTAWLNDFTNGTVGTGCP
jgi:hypothetical protein